MIINEEIHKVKIKERMWEYRERFLFSWDLNIELSVIIVIIIIHSYVKKLIII